jgi:hypothetical protein
VTATWEPSPPEVQEISPDDLARIRLASARDKRQKLLIAALITAIGIGASIMSCVGQSFSYRQARALEGIEQQLEAIQASCSRETSHPP